MPPAAGPPEPGPRGGSAEPGVRSTTGARRISAHTRRRELRSTPRAQGPGRPASGDSPAQWRRTAPAAGRRGPGIAAGRADEAPE
ncbi:hypothetical protein NGM37_58115, partial [Streptomyces sp. TRM76130]|nr:hypothetical protein [Streptomyces sp. TRM76130]